MKTIAVSEGATKRFWAKVSRGDGCWIWEGSLASNGYGQMSMPNGTKRGTLIRAHRYSWALHSGSVPESLHVLHRCDVRSCVRPDHLFLGTLSDNMKDMVAKNRRRGGVRDISHCKRGHAFSGSNIYRSPSGQRKCRTCLKLLAERRKTPEAKLHRNKRQRKYRAAVRALIAQLPNPPEKERT